MKCHTQRWNKVESLVPWQRWVWDDCVGRARSHRHSDLSFSIRVSSTIWSLPSLLGEGVDLSIPFLSPQWHCGALCILFWWVFSYFFICRTFACKRDGCPMASLIATLTPCVSAHFDSQPHNHLLNTHCEGFHLKFRQPRKESSSDRGIDCLEEAGGWQCLWDCPNLANCMGRSTVGSNIP